MLRLRRGTWFWLILLLTVFSGALYAASARQVVIISLDGLRPDALHHARTPHLDALWQRGAYTWRAQTVLPSVTLVAHASMLSGVTPAKHGITWNYWSPRRGYIRTPTVFQVAVERGLDTAMFVAKKRLQHLVPPAFRQQGTKGTRVHFEHAGYTDRDVVEAVLAHWQKHQPALTFIHLPDPDSAGHAHGWMSRRQLQTIAQTDAAVGTLVRALYQLGRVAQTVLIVTADHGGHGKRHGSNCPEDLTIPWIVWGMGVKRGYEIQRQVHIYDTAATAAWALGLPLPAEWEGKPVTEAWAGHPDAGHTPSTAIQPPLATPMQATPLPPRCSHRWP
ncbi:MAG TPA: alkaline phosphatase family protein, partial [Armatimonadetes bacterium]|nr:alkaline phosphatase family protein [Armatimonadota bacterium]